VTKPQFSGGFGSPGRLAIVVLIGLCLLTAVLGDAARSGLRYERLGLIEGEWWRVVTGHLVHLGPTHTILNLVGLGLLGWLFGPVLRPWEWFTAGLTAALAIALGLFIGSPQIAWYVGLSGVLHGWFAAGAARVSEQEPRPGAVMLLGLAAKLGWEQFRGAMPTTLALEVGPVVVDAHLYGALGGILCYVIWRVRVLVAGSGTPV